MPEKPIAGIIVVLWALINANPAPTPTATPMLQPVSQSAIVYATADPTAEPTATPKPTKKPKKKIVHCDGVYMITAYCPCSKCCGYHSNGITATGTKARQGRTIAVDPDIIPYGTRVKIGKLWYTAEDCGSKVKKRHIDLFFNSHQDALDWGVKYKKIYRKKVRK